MVFGEVLVSSLWKSTALVHPTIFPSRPLLEIISLKRYAGRECGWEASVRWSCEADVVKHSYCCAKRNARIPWRNLNLECELDGIPSVVFKY